MPTTNPAHFQAIPWCAALLADSKYVVVPSRFGKPMPDSRGEFFTRTLATNSTVTACVYQIRKSSPNDIGGPSNISAPDHAPRIVSEVRAFLDTASGVNGFPGIAHGGFVSAVIDEVMGFLINSEKVATETARDLHDSSTQPQPVPMTVPRSSVMTAELTIKYRRPVPTGEPLVVRAWIERSEGRKIFVSAVVEDSERQVLTEGFGLFLALKSGAKLPEVRRKNAKM